MRTFVAVEIQNKEVLDSIAKLQSELKIKAKPVSRENMHFTLLFLGEVAAEVAPKIMERLQSVMFSPIEVNFNKVSAFPNSRSARVVWIGVDDAASQNLIKLAIQVEEKLEPLGFKSDKPFKPHLTIFRIKNHIDDISKELERLKTVTLSSLS